MVIAGACVIVALGIGIAIAATRGVVVQREDAKRVRTVFSRYFPPSVVEDILARQDADVFRGRSGRATILVCRIWNFAHILEGRTPADALKYLNEFYTVAGSSIHKFNGMIDKFLGDGITGVFGMPPMTEQDQEENAIRAALDIARLVNALDLRWKSQSRTPFHVGIGINSGVIIAGDIGFKDRREYTVVGPEALVAARLQEQTEELNASILVSKGTLDPVRDMFDYAPLQRIPMRGMRRNLEVYVLRGVADRKEEALAPPDPEGFNETTVSEPPPAAAAATAPPPKEEPLRPTPVVKPVRSPHFGTGPRVTNMTPPQRPKKGASIDPPELRGPRVGRVDDPQPAMPDAPAPRAVYEDGGGPPVALPP